MSLPILLFLLRIGSAVLLLSFLALIAWLLVADLRATRLSLSVQPHALGLLRVVGSTTGVPALDTTYAAGPVTTIGRSGRNAIVLDEAYVSAEHAILTRQDEHWWLEDLGSRNGTLLNQLPVGEATVVSNGDRITIGGVELRLELLAEGERENEESGIRDSNP